MTIHKSKGLEFEVVLVPDLQARTRGGSRKMLSWLERGLAEPDDSSDITEFLIAPFQRKGTGKGSAGDSGSTASITSAKSRRTGAAPLCMASAVLSAADAVLAFLEAGLEGAASFTWLVTSSIPTSTLASRPRQGNSSASVAA